MKAPFLLSLATALQLLAHHALGQPGGRVEPTIRASSSLEFIENKGQWAGAVRYAAALPGGRLFAEAQGLTFALLANGGPAQRGHAAAGHRRATGPATTGPTKRPTDSPTDSPPDGLVRGHALTLHFEGAAPAIISPEVPTNEHRNYFLGNDAQHWASNVSSCRELHYAGLWPGVEARVYESPDQHLEYDFELAPGADPAAIGLRHDGATNLTLDSEGNLRVGTSVGTLTERAPRAWQTTASGQRQPVPCRYLLTGQVVRFVLDHYDHTRPLTIDPVVVFATYTGSTADNWGFTATHDAQGNLYSGGIVFEVGYPASPGAFSTTFAGLIDMAIIKYNTSVSGPAARVWATYLGGADADFPTSLVVNSQGELLVLGTTSSNNFPTTVGAVQRTFAGGTSADPYGYGPGYSLANGADLVITRLAATGAALVGSTYLGGSGNDGLLPLNVNVTAQLAHNYGDPFRGDILVDAADNVYVASHTASRDFPLPPGQGFNRSYGGGTTDGLVLKLSPTLTALTWGSYLSGADADAAYSIQVEPVSGDVYVAGGTLSANFPTTPGCYRPVRPGNVDGFVARIAADGRRLQRATYLGTSSYDQGYFLQLGTDGGVYVLGQTAGAYPTTPGLYTTPNGRQFIHKLDADLATTQLATVFGSGRATIDIDPTAFLVDRCDRVYVCGWGGTLNQGEPYLALNGSTDQLPTTSGAVQTTTDTNDFYLVQFAAGLTALGYATFYGAVGAGGDHVDGGTSRFDPRGVVYQAVCSCFSTAGFPIPPGANTYSASNGSSCNNAAFVFNFEASVANAGTDQTVCTTATPFALTGSPGGGEWSGPGVGGNLAQGFVFTPSVALLGVQVLTYTVAGTGLCTTSATRRITVEPTPVAAFALPQTTYCVPANPPVVPLVGTPAGGTFGGPGVRGSVATGFTFEPALVPNAGSYNLTYVYAVGGCTSQAIRAVRVVRASAGADLTLCSIASPVALLGTPTGGTWTGPGVSGSPATGFVFTPSNALAGPNRLVYDVFDALSGCTATSTRNVSVTAATRIAVTPVPPRCAADLTPISLQGTPAGGIWTGPGVFGNGASYFLSPNPLAGTVALRYAVAGTCPQQATLNVVTNASPNPTLPPDTVLCPSPARQSFALRGQPAGGVFSGLGVSGSPTTGFVFSPPAGFGGSTSLTYTVVSNGCTGVATRRVSVAVAPPLAPTWVPVACPETRLVPLAVRFGLGNAPNAGPLAVVWDFGDGTQATEAAPVHTYTAPGRYQPRATVRYNGGRCEIQATLLPVEATDRQIPNIITPNGDGQNETFQLGPDCGPRLQVFSRWGQGVFDSPSYHDEWAASGQPAGLYYYLLTYPDGHRVRGWVEVVR